MEEAALRALGLAGISRETLRVARSYPPGISFLAAEVIVLTLSLLAHIAVCPVLFSYALASSDAGAGLLRLAINWAPFFLVEAAFLLAIVVQSLGATAFCVFSVGPRYGMTDDRAATSVARDLRTVPRSLATFLVSVFRGASRSAARLIRTGPKVAWRLVVTSFDAFLLLIGFTALFGTAAWLAHGHLVKAASGEQSGAQLAWMALSLLASGLYFAGAGHIGSLWRVASVMMVLEDAWGFRALRMSDELLLGARMFWAPAAAMTLDGCILAAQLAFRALVVDDVMGLCVWLRLAAAMAVALWAAVMAWLVAQVVVFFACKCHQPTTPRASWRRRPRPTPTSADDVY